MRRIFVSLAAGMAFIAILTACAGQRTTPSAGEEERTKIAEINTKLAIAYMQDDDNELALKKLDKAVESDSRFAPAYSTRGLLYHRIGEYEKSDVNFKQALKIEPDNSSILNNYGQALCQRGLHARGQEMFVKATKNPLYRTPEVALSNAGICAMESGDNETAERYFREALQINARIATVLLRMSMINADAGRYLPARGYLQRYIEIAPHTAQSLWLGIRIERELGDKDALASYSLQLSRNFPDSIEAGMLLESKGKR